MYQTSDIKEGMTVRSADGHKLGKVYAVGETEFHIEKGLFFPKDYACRFSEISDIRNGEIILAHGRDSLRSVSDEVPYGAQEGLAAREGIGTSPVTAAGIGTSPREAGVPTEGERKLTERSGEVTIPVHKEELDVSKRQVDAGEVRVHKGVVEEEKTVEVPVRRERVRVERRDVTDRPAMHASFQEETVSVPMRAEEVEARKRAVVDEEVVIRKDELEEERRVSEPLRREEVDIRGSGEVEGPRRIGLSEEEERGKRQ